MPIIRCHHDSDGVASAFFASFGYPNHEIEIWDGIFGDTTGLTSGDIMVDMRPKQNLEGLIVYDHHGPYPEDRKYKLTTAHEPASWICFNEFKDKVPKDEWWKMAVGVMGDGQPELIPYEVYKECPELFMQIKTSSYQNYGKWKTSYFPLYKLLSSKINALLRLRRYDEALKTFSEVKRPLDLYMDKECNKAQAKVKSEFSLIMSSHEGYNFDKLKVCVFDSDVRMTGYVATVVGSEGDTVLAINRTDGSASLRGDLALYWKEKLNHLSYLNIDGHPGFMGANIIVNPSILIRDLQDLLN